MRGGRILVPILVLTLIAGALPATALLSRPAEATTPVAIVHAAATRDETTDYPARAAGELAHILRDVGGLKRVTNTPAQTVDEFRALVRGSTAPALVLFAHADPTGLRVAGTLIPWSSVREDLAANAATEIFIGGCDSAWIGDVEGKTIVTTFDGLVDYRYAAPAIASDLVATVTPEIDAAFEPRFLAYLEAQGGLQTYGMLKEFPEKVLSACDDALEAWYRGEFLEHNGCIYYLDGANLNCHNPAHKNREGCQRLTPEDQDQYNAESTGDASASFGDGSSSSAAAAGGTTTASTRSGGSWWNFLSGEMSFGVQGGVGGSSAHVRYGKIQPDDCFDLLTYDFTGGGAVKVFGQILKKWKEAGGTKQIKPAAKLENSVGLRICGNFEMSTPRVTTGGASFQGDGLLDIRGSYRAMTSFESKVFRWTVTLHVGMEGGVKYPFQVGLSGNVGLCSQNPAIRYQIDGEIDGQGLRAFAYALAAYKEFGFEHDFGWAFSHQMRVSRACPGSSPAASVQLSDDLASPLGVTLDRLVDAGIGIRNPAPTLVNVQEDGGHVYVKASLASFTPDTLGFAHLRNVGALAALGVPADLPLDQQILLDLTNLRVQELLGLDLGEVTPLFALDGGVVILPRAIPYAASVERFCGAPPGESILLEAVYCDGLAVAPLQLVGPAECSGALGAPLPEANTWSAGGTYSQLGAVAPAPCLAPAVALVELFNAGYDEAQGQACTPLEGPAHDPCGMYAALTTGSGGGTQVSLITAIHQTFQILSRPTEAWSIIGKCNLHVADVKLGQVVVDAIDMIPPNTELRDADLCMEARNSLEAKRINLGVIDHQFREGAILIAEYANSAAFIVGSRADPPNPFDLVPSDIGDLNDWVNEQAEDAWQTVCPTLGIEDCRS